MTFFILYGILVSQFRPNHLAIVCDITANAPKGNIYLHLSPKPLLFQFPHLFLPPTRPYPNSSSSLNKHSSQPISVRFLSSFRSFLSPSSYHHTISPSRTRTIFPISIFFLFLSNPYLYLSFGYVLLFILPLPIAIYLFFLLSPSHFRSSFPITISFPHLSLAHFFPLTFHSFPISILLSSLIPNSTTYHLAIVCDITANAPKGNIYLHPPLNLYSSNFPIFP